jgi:ATP-dependent RNA circularization protein (DNA/RNA ligase family)
MKLTIEIHMDNVAFEENEDEVHSILSNINQKMKEDIVVKLRDTNGNTVGWYKITED